MYVSVALTTCSSANTVHINPLSQWLTHARAPTTPNTVFFSIVGSVRASQSCLGGWGLGAQEHESHDTSDELLRKTADSFSWRLEAWRILAFLIQEVGKWDFFGQFHQNIILDLRPQPCQSGATATRTCARRRVFVLPTPSASKVSFASFVTLDIRSQNPSSTRMKESFSIPWMKQKCCPWFSCFSEKSAPSFQGNNKMH